MVFGVLLGVSYFRLLYWNARLHLAGRRLALALHPLRLAALGLVLALVAGCGAWPLLLVFSGLLIGRLMILRMGRSR